MKKTIRNILSKRTRDAIKFDYIRFKARTFGKDISNAQSSKLHFGCGYRRIEGWLNIDVINSEYNIDLGSGKLPFQSNRFESVVSQHVIEHLELDEQLTPLLLELHRVLKNQGEIWLSCPDIEKVCKAYLDDKGEALVKDRQSRFPDFSMHGVPSSHMINLLFHQWGEHKNLFDFVLLKWLLEKTGFSQVERVSEEIFLKRFPEFPQRQDDFQSLYVKAVKITKPAP